MTTTSRARIAPPDYLLFMRDNTLLSQHVNWETLKPLGEPVAITDEVRTGGGNGRNAFSVSSTGVLLYRGGNTLNQQFHWYTRDGKPDGPAIIQGDINAIELSPDNKRAIVERRTSGVIDLWLVEFPGAVMSRLTSDAGGEVDAVWSPDSRRVVFYKDTNGGELYQIVIGSGRDSLVATWLSSVEAWTRDGLLVRKGNQVLLLPAPEENATKPVTEKPRLLLDPQYQVDQMRVSPDGKWVAYRSRESGGDETWVAAFPGFTDRRKVSGSVPAADAPLWSADGKELIFLSGEALFSVDVKTGATFEASDPKPALNAPGAAINVSTVHRYTLSNDRKRFLVREVPNTTGNQIEPLYQILNWPSLR